uniref:Uncharacterized protein n=1 Tax=Pelusios castaneus TaxID=367368 RepID=A0A8C8VPH1_9SAUR
MANVEKLVQEVDTGRCVGIQITNSTRDVTLENPRIYCFSGHAMIDPVPQILPCSSENFLFVKTSYTARGSVGVLSYESDAITLVIMFSNPFDRILYSCEFAIKLFAGRKHFQSMERLYHYMYSHKPPFKSKSFQRMKLADTQDGQLEVTKREIQMKATMSNMKKSTIKVQIEQGESCSPYTGHSANLEGTQE